MKGAITVYRDKRHLIHTLVGPNDEVLDIGFFGHGDGVSPSHEQWAHRLLQERAKEVWGLDLDYDEAVLKHPEHYKKGSAEDFEFGRTFDVIFAGDIIEHLANPGLFLACARRHLRPTGRLVVTTPSAFNLFNLFEKISKIEPSVNREHTMYFNLRTLRNLVEAEWNIAERGYLYRLDMTHKESWKKKMLNLLYAILSHFTSKYMETIVMVLVAKNERRASLSG